MGGHGPNFEITFAAVQWIGHRGRRQDEASGADHSKPEVAWTKEMAEKWERRG